MALDSLIKTNLQGTITLSDGTGTPVTMALTFDQGDLSVGPIKKVLNETVKIERRGNLATATPGNRIYPSGSFTCWIAQLTDATAAVITDFILGANSFSANVSTLGSTHPVFTMDLIYAIEGTDFGGVDSTFTLADCDITIDSITESAEGISMSISFEVLGAITGDIAAAEYS